MVKSYVLGKEERIFMPQISVVVPVYNVEKYIAHCIESIIAQTYRDFELILVDDGSKDNCPQICDSYAKKDKRIRVIHKENGGLSDARNAGTLVAEGKYITYIDSDDYVNPLYLEMLLKAIIQTGADLSIVDFKKVYSMDECDCVNKRNIRISKKPAHDVLSLILYQKIHDVSAWGMLLPLWMAKKHFFPKGRLFEDLFTTYKFYLEASEVAIVRVKLYYYLQRNNSIMNGNYNREYLQDMIEASENIITACRESDILSRAAKNKCFSNYCNIIIYCDEIMKNDCKLLDKINGYLDEQKYKILFDNDSRVKNRLAALCLVFGNNVLKTLFAIICHVRYRRKRKA